MTQRMERRIGTKETGIVGLFKSTSNNNKQGKNVPCHIKGIP